MSTTLPTVRAAGCLIWRYGTDEPEVIVVHRPRWSDWSFPKGKIDPGERAVAAAVREAHEETGLRVRIGPRLRDDHYPLLTGQPKVVHYWIAKPPGTADITTYEPNQEIDQVAWMSLSKARKTLSYPRDVELLDEFEVSSFDTYPLIIARHAEARKRRTWHRDDNERPLSAEGRRAADGLVPVFAAYGVSRVVTSDAVRCVDTMVPFVNASGAKVRLEEGLSEERCSDKTLAKLAAKALDSSKRMVICTHRPVIPRLCRALGIGVEEIEPSGLIVIHRRNGKVRSVEKPG